MEKEVLKELITHNLDDIAKIAVSLSTKLDAAADSVGYMQFLLLQYGESFARAKQHLGNPYLSIQENFDKRGIRNPNPEYDVNAVVHNYVQSQLRSPEYIHDGASIFHKNFAQEIYMPKSIEKPHLQVPLVNLARLSIADAGLTQLEQKKLALQDGLMKLSDRGQELFNLIIETAKKEEFVMAYAKAYLERFNLEGGVNGRDDDYSYSLYTPYKKGAWNNSIGDFDEDGGEHVLTCRI